jgi:hypothetical protein
MIHKSLVAELKVAVATPPREAFAVAMFTDPSAIWPVVEFFWLTLTRTDAALFVVTCIAGERKTALPVAT